MTLAGRVACAIFNIPTEQNVPPEPRYARLHVATARKYVMVNFKPWEDASALQVTERIPDEHTGQQTERSIAFGLEER